MSRMMWKKQLIGGTSNSAAAIEYDPADSSRATTNVESELDRLNQNLTELGGIRYNKSTHYIQVQDSNDNWVNYKYFNPDAPAALIPLMTSNTTPSGICDCGATPVPAAPAYHAFDQDAGTYWYTNSSPTWVSYQFDNPVLVVRVTVTTVMGASAPSASITYQLQGWNGSTWENIDGATFDCVKNSTKNYDIDISQNEQPYSKYRAYYNGTGGVANSWSAAITRLQLYGYYV